MATVDQTKRTGAGTVDNPLTDIQVQDLLDQGISEGDYVAGKGTLTRLGTFNTSTTTPEPTIGTALGTSATGTTTGSSFSQPGLSTYGDPEIEAILRAQATAQTDPAQIRRDTLKMFQAEIDAANAVYDQMVRQAQIEGSGRLGSQRAIAARGGLLGSDFAGAQKEKVQQYNTDIIGGIQSERQAKISEIMGVARGLASQEIANQTAAQQAGATSYLAYLQNAQTNKANNINAVVGAMLTQQVDPATMMPEELQQIADELGTSTQDLVAQYQSAKVSSEAAAQEASAELAKTESETAKNLAAAQADKIKTVGEGTVVYNIETGEVYKNPKTYAPKASSSLSIGSGYLTQEAVAGVHQTLSESRGEDGFTNTQLYLDELSGFVALGGDPKDFVKEYDPDIYINPADPSRSFLKAYMQKSDSSNLFLGSLGGVDITSAINQAAASG